jgi:hypothetical protein
MDTHLSLPQELWEQTPPAVQAYIGMLEARVVALEAIVHSLEEQVRTLQEQRKPGHALLYCSGELSRLETVPHPCFAPLWYMSISLQAVS